VACNSADVAIVVWLATDLCSNNLCRACCYCIRSSRPNSSRASHKRQNAVKQTAPKSRCLGQACPVACMTAPTATPRATSRPVPVHVLLRLGRLAHSSGMAGLAGRQTRRGKACDRCNNSLSLSVTEATAPQQASLGVPACIHHIGALLSDIRSHPMLVCVGCT
jgi:hypothetical protein